LLGLLVGDTNGTILPYPMVAIPAHEYSACVAGSGYTPSHTLYLKEGEVIGIPQGNLTEAQESAQATGLPIMGATSAGDAGDSVKQPKKPSKYNRAYARAFKSVAGRYKTKNGKWKKNGFRSASRAAHKIAGGKN